MRGYILTRRAHVERVRSSREVYQECRQKCHYHKPQVRGYSRRLLCSLDRSHDAPAHADQRLYRLLLFVRALSECTSSYGLLFPPADMEQCAPLSGGKIPPNFFHIPLAYNGRASSVLPSPHPIKRPKGAINVPDKDEPVHEASRKVDFELERGWFVSKPIPYGSTLSIENAAEHIFGMVLLNDWSSRDIQRFEMAPLGPFNSKCEYDATAS